MGDKLERIGSVIIMVGLALMVFLLAINKLNIFVILLAMSGGIIGALGALINGAD